MTAFFLHFHQQGGSVIYQAFILPRLAKHARTIDLTCSFLFLIAEWIFQIGLMMAVLPFVAIWSLIRRGYNKVRAFSVRRFLGAFKVWEWRWGAGKKDVEVVEDILENLVPSGNDADAVQIEVSITMSPSVNLPDQPHQITQPTSPTADHLHRRRASLLPTSQEITAYTLSSPQTLRKAVHQAREIFGDLDSKRREVGKKRGEGELVRGMMKKRVKEMEEKRGRVTNANVPVVAPAPGVKKPAKSVAFVTTANGPAESSAAKPARVAGPSRQPPAKSTVGKRTGIPSAGPSKPGAARGRARLAGCEAEPVVNRPASQPATGPRSDIAPIAPSVYPPGTLYKGQGRLAPRPAQPSARDSLAFASGSRSAVRIPASAPAPAPAPAAAPTTIIQRPVIEQPIIRQPVVENSIPASADPYLDLDSGQDSVPMSPVIAELEPSTSSGSTFGLGLGDLPGTGSTLMSTTTDDSRRSGSRVIPGSYPSVFSSSPPSARMHHRDGPQQNGSDRVYNPAGYLRESPVPPPPSYTSGEPRRSSLKSTELSSAPPPPIQAGLAVPARPQLRKNNSLGLVSTVDSMRSPSIEPTSTFAHTASTDGKYSPLLQNQAAFQSQAAFQNHLRPVSSTEPAAATNLTQGQQASLSAPVSTRPEHALSHRAHISVLPLPVMTPATSPVVERRVSIITPREEPENPIAVNGALDKTRIPVEKRSEQISELSSTIAEALDAGPPIPETQQVANNEKRTEQISKLSSTITEELDAALPTTKRRQVVGSEKRSEQISKLSSKIAEALDAAPPTPKRRQVGDNEDGSPLTSVGSVDGDSPGPSSKPQEDSAPPDMPKRLTRAMRPVTSSSKSIDVNDTAARRATRASAIGTSSVEATGIKVTSAVSRLARRELPLRMDAAVTSNTIRVNTISRQVRSVTTSTAVDIAVERIANERKRKDPPQSSTASTQTRMAPTIHSRPLGAAQRALRPVLPTAVHTKIDFVLPDGIIAAVTPVRRTRSDIEREDPTSQPQASPPKKRKTDLGRPAPSGSLPTRTRRGADLDEAPARRRSKRTGQRGTTHI